MTNIEQHWMDESSELRIRLQSLLVIHFGERCPDYEPDCICCQRWKSLDELLADPYSDWTQGAGA